LQLLYIFIILYKKTMLFSFLFVGYEECNHLKMINKYLKSNYQNKLNSMLSPRRVEPILVISFSLIRYYEVRSRYQNKIYIKKMLIIFIILVSDRS